MVMLESGEVSGATAETQAVIRQAQRGVIRQPGGAVVAIDRIRRGERFSFRAPAGRYVVSALAGDRESGFFRYPPVAVSLTPGSTARIITAPRACA
jgi:hypothetical protein